MCHKSCPTWAIKSYHSCWPTAIFTHLQSWQAVCFTVASVVAIPGGQNWVGRAKWGQDWHWPLPLDRSLRPGSPTWDCLILCQQNRRQRVKETPCRKQGFPGGREWTSLFPVETTRYTSAPRQLATLASRQLGIGLPILPHFLVSFLFQQNYFSHKFSRWEEKTTSPKTRLSKTHSPFFITGFDSFLSECCCALAGKDGNI